MVCNIVACYHIHCHWCIGDWRTISESSFSALQIEAERRCNYYKTQATRAALTWIGEIVCKNNSFDKSWLCWDEHNVATWGWNKTSSFLKICCLSSKQYIHGTSNPFPRFLLPMTANRLSILRVSVFPEQFFRVHGELSVVLSWPFFVSFATLV